MFLLLFHTVYLKARDEIAIVSNIPKGITLSVNRYVWILWLLHKRLRVSFYRKKWCNIYVLYTIALLFPMQTTAL